MLSPLSATALQPVANGARCSRSPSLLLEEETEAQRGHSPCQGTGALGFYCGLSVPFVTTRQHCLFLGLRSEQSGREASVGGLVICCNLGTQCQGVGAPCGG